MLYLIIIHQVKEVVKVSLVITTVQLQQWLWVNIVRQLVGCYAIHPSALPFTPLSAPNETVGLSFNGLQYVIVSRGEGLCDGAGA